MTVSSTTNKAIHTGDNTTVVFSYTYRADNDGDIAVYLDDVLQPSGWTVAREPDDIGGVVTFSIAPGVDVVIAILRELELDQNTDYTPYDAFPADAHENALDKLTMIDQQQQEQIDRSVKVPEGDDGSVDLTLPPYEVGKGLMWSESDPKKLVNSEDDLNGITGAAAASAAAANDSAIAAGISAGASSDSAGASSDSAGESSDSAIASGISAGESSDSAGESAASAITSGISAGESSDSAGESSDSATHSYNWSSAGEDVPVDDGTNQGFSAYHWAQKAFDNSHLAAINELITAATIDVAIYNASDDNDSGAWIDKCAWTSWYNETLNTATRGATKDFPRLCVAVAEINTVTLYDATDPSLPMWMVFQQGGAYPSLPILGRTVPNITSVKLKEATLCVTFGNAGYGESLVVINFASDDKPIMYSDAASSWHCGNTIAQRNDDMAISIDAAIGDIIGMDSRDVDIKVLDGAPIDVSSGLAIPTIAVATQNGASIISPDGTVYDITDASGFGQIVFSPDGAEIWLSAIAGSSDIQSVGPLPISSDIASNWRDRYYNRANSTPGLVSSSSGQKALFNAVGGVQGLSLFLDAETVAHIAYDFNSGNMYADIKGAWLASIDDADLVGSELILNGTFDTDLSFWTVEIGSTWDAGTVNVQPLNFLGVSQNMAVVIGVPVVVTVEITDIVVNTGRFYVGDETISTIYYNSSGLGVGIHTITVIPLTTTLSVSVGGSAQTGANLNFDNISVKTADVDRSVNGNGLAVNGTITKTAVASGSELMAYSGFSAANYLEAIDASYVDTLYNYGWVKDATNGWEFKHGVVSAGDIDGLTIVATVLHIEGTLPKSLIRIGDQPSANQINAIYEAEKRLFQENVACTLSGSSSDIQALDLDEVTDELHVCTTTDRSVFNGLVRVDEENVAYTSIAANNRLLAKGN